MSAGGISRRRFTAAMLTSTVAGTSMAQVLAQEVPGQPATETAAAGILHSQVRPADWRKLLLQGARGILARRDGLAEMVPYLNQDNTINPKGYTRLCYMLRDVKAERMVTIDLDLLDVLCGIQRWAAYNGVSTVINITSGFRSDETNHATEGAAKNSLHRLGRATDFYIPGMSANKLGAMAKIFNDGGGVGLYLSRGFVHVDSGPARTWRGK